MWNDTIRWILIIILSISLIEYSYKVGIIRTGGQYNDTEYRFKIFSIILRLGIIGVLVI